MRVLRVKDWNQHFETAQSRKIRGPLPWFAAPTKHDGKGYRKLMRHEDGTALYGAWILIAAVAAKSPLRGYLIDADGPLTPDDISLKTDAPTVLVTRALEVLTNEIGWMEAIECESIAELVARWERDTTTAHDAPDTVQYSTRHKSCTCTRTKSVNRSGQRSKGVDGLLPPFDTITTETLLAADKLRTWFLDSAASISLNTGDVAWETCCAAACKASTEGRVPPKLFQKLMRTEKNRKSLTEAEKIQGRQFAKGKAV